MAHEFFIPDRIISDEGALDLLRKHIKDCGKKALIVTGKNVHKLACFEALCGMLNSEGIDFAVFDGITGEPDDLMIAVGAKEYKKTPATFLLR